MSNQWRLRTVRSRFLGLCLVFAMAVTLAPGLASATTTVGENTSVGGTFAVDGNVTLGNANTDSVTMTAYVVSPLRVADGTNTSTLANTTLLLGQADSFAQGKFYVNASGNVNTSGTLAVVGASTLTGALTANGNVTLGDAVSDLITVNGYVVSPLRVADGTNTSTLANTSLVIAQADSFNQGKFSVSSAGNIMSSGTLGVVGASTLLGAVTTYGSVTLGDAISDLITVNGYVVSPLNVANGTNTSTLSNTTLLVAKADDFNQGKFYVNASGNINTSGTLAVAGNTTLTGELSILGDITLGNAGTDSIDVNGYVVTSLRVGDGTSATSTLGQSSLIVAQTEASNLGRFYVGSSGNVNASGTVQMATSTVMNVTGTSTFYAKADAAGYGGSLILEKANGSGCIELSFNQVGNTVTSSITCP
ncbi:MAG: hypothetical protein AAB390_01760 [Patescibacteria group bacterium]